MAVMFRSKVMGWKLVSNAMKARQAELPDLADAQVELDALIAQAEPLEHRQKQQSGALKRTIRERQELEAKGELLRRRLFGVLHYRLGFTDESLVDFGMKPEKKRRRKSEPAPAPQPAPPAPASGDPAKQ